MALNVRKIIIIKISLFKSCRHCPHSCVILIILFSLVYNYKKICYMENYIFEEFKNIYLNFKIFISLIYKDILFIYYYDYLIIYILRLFYNI